MSSNDKLNLDGLSKVWQKVFGLVKILTGDVDVINKGSLQEQINEAVSIAKGRNQAHVFATTEDLQSWLSNADNKGLYNVGDNLYIVDVGVPDWWIKEVLEEADTDTGYYYKIAQLEVQKVDLSEYLKSTGDTKKNVTTFTSGDSTSPTAWTDVAVLTTGEKHSSIFNKISTMFKNIRWLYKMLGTADISALGGGTVTGAITELNDALGMRKVNAIGEIMSSVHIVNYTHDKEYMIRISIDGLEYYWTFIGSRTHEIHHRELIGNGSLGYFWLKITANGIVEFVNAWLNDEWVEPPYKFCVFENTN